MAVAGNFRPDAGVSFKAEFNENTPYPMKHEPTGTNLFDGQQAEVMVRYMLEGLPMPDRHVTAGPAFPITEIRDINGCGVVEGCTGLSKREYMATQIAAGISASDDWRERTVEGIKEIADLAVAQTDALFFALTRAAEYEATSKQTGDGK